MPLAVPVDHCGTNKLPAVPGDHQADVADAPQAALAGHSAASIEHPLPLIVQLCSVVV